MYINIIYISNKVLIARNPAVLLNRPTHLDSQSRKVSVDLTKIMSNSMPDCMYDRIVCDNQRVLLQVMTYECETKCDSVLN